MLFEFSFSKIIIFFNFQQKIFCKFRIFSNIKKYLLYILWGIYKAIIRQYSYIFFCILYANIKLFIALLWNAFYLHFCSQTQFLSILSFCLRTCFSMCICMFECLFDFLRRLWGFVVYSFMFLLFCFIFSTFEFVFLSWLLFVYKNHIALVFIFMFIFLTRFIFVFLCCVWGFILLPYFML